MKKGFFLLEALLACVLISLFVGIMIRYHAQWFSSHKKMVDYAKALEVLIELAEDSAKRSKTILDGFIITKKIILVPAPELIDAELFASKYPPAKCTQITISWSDFAGGSSALCALIGADNEQ